MERSVLPSKYILSQEIWDKLKKLGFDIKYGISDELLEMLPRTIIDTHRDYNYKCLLYVNPYSKGWSVCYSSCNGEYGIKRKKDLSLPNALGKMMIYLKENKLIE